MNAQQTVQAKQYTADGALIVLGLSLTQWATIVGIIGTLIGVVLAFKTYMDGKRYRQGMAERDRERTRMQREEHDLRMDDID